ncbi:hypothetical protein J8273_2945 [Carpediemonas membranifera]|uniref:Uncharacterized protein n=1 Tax=Carpediemonas membranifera TaxID=201153 RepID=A0A8J6E318_9EUKA|nr:hypothetical protein J8273_2945 [Carpediemonas membranifera]|eukprot:KAG9395378.1 hypothetical protein J8273_2945 [Carpediemonas membranifera]
MKSRDNRRREEPYKSSRHSNHRQRHDNDRRRDHSSRDSRPRRDDDHHDDTRERQPNTRLNKEDYSLLHRVENIIRPSGRNGSVAMVEESAVIIDLLFSTMQGRANIFCKDVFGARMVERGLCYSTHKQFMGFFSELFTYLDAADERKFARFVNHQHASNAIQTLIALLPRALAMEELTPTPGLSLDHMVKSIVKWTCDGNFIADEPGDCGSHVLRASLRVACGLPAIDDNRIAARRHMVLPTEHKATGTPFDWTWTDILAPLVSQISADPEAINFLRVMTETPSGSVALQEVVNCCAIFAKDQPEAATSIEHLARCILDVGLDENGDPVDMKDTFIKRWPLHKSVTGDARLYRSHLTVSFITHGSGELLAKCYTSAVPAGKKAEDLFTALADEPASLILSALAGHNTFVPADHGRRFLALANRVFVEMMNERSGLAAKPVTRGHVEFAVAALSRTDKLYTKQYRDLFVSTIAEVLKFTGGSDPRRSEKGLGCFYRGLCTLEDMSMRIKLTGVLLQAGFTTQKLYNKLYTHLSFMDAQDWLAVRSDPVATQFEQFFNQADADAADSPLRKIVDGDLVRQFVTSKAAFLLASIINGSSIRTSKNGRQYRIEAAQAVMDCKDAASELRARDPQRYHFVQICVDRVWTDPRNRSRIRDLKEYETKAAVMEKRRRRALKDRFIKEDNQ